MKINIFSLFWGILLPFFFSCATIPPATAQTIDPEKPNIEFLTEQQIQEWNAKPIEDWNKFFGAETEVWNPFQMKFYEDISISALSEEEKEELKNYTDEDWEKRFGGTIDTWKIHYLLFYSAIINLSVN